MKWDITDKQLLTFSNTYYPDLEEIEEFRNITKAEWLLKMDAAKNMSFKLGLENEHISDPGGSAESNDLKYYGALVFDF